MKIWKEISKQNPTFGELVLLAYKENNSIFVTTGFLEAITKDGCVFKTADVNAMFANVFGTYRGTVSKFTHWCEIPDCDF